MDNKIPKVFISYSWDNESHKDWVLYLATKLLLNGVDVFLDVWDLGVGKDKDFFMENSVRESDKVLLIMTPNYKIKAENRKGGVGNEISMIKAEKFSCQETEKFIPIVRQGNRNECTPLFVKSLVDIDMSIEDNFEINFEELLRTIYGEPKYEKPPLGKKPEFTKPKKSVGWEISDLIEESQLNKQKNIEKFDLEFDLPSVSIETIVPINEINVCISKPEPIVILFGAQCSGKTMAIIRLTRYLKENGYIVEPDRIFRSTTDTFYHKVCDRFNQEVYNDTAVEARGNLNFMLLSVFNKYGSTICQILDAPGTHYFDCNNNNTFPPYINHIIHAKNQKIWICLVEKDWGDMQTRMAYAEKIAHMRYIMSPKDKTILMCSKVDMHKQLFFNGLPDTKYFFNDIKNQYPHIFGRFKNENPITKLFSSYLFDFIMFSAGNFHQRIDNSLVYTQSNSRYPATLWKAILKAIK
jgi:hypothetical protein